MIKEIMRKFGYINESNLISVAIETYEKNDTCNASDEKDFYFRSGNANAIGYICGRLGIDIVEIIRERRTDESD